MNKFTVKYKLYWWRNAEYLAATSQWQTLWHAFLSSTLRGFRTHNFSDDRHWLHGSFKFNYHRIRCLVEFVLHTFTPLFCGVCITLSIVLCNVISIIAFVFVLKIGPISSTPEECVVPTPLVIQFMLLLLQSGNMFLTIHYRILLCTIIATIGATRGIGTAYRSETHTFTPVV
jgi:hypothetical protein